MTKSKTIYKYQHLAGFGNVWHFDGYFYPESKRLKVTKIYGDVTDEHIGLVLRAFGADAGAETLIVPETISHYFN